MLDLIDDDALPGLHEGHKFLRSLLVGRDEGLIGADGDEAWLPYASPNSAEQMVSVKHGVKITEHMVE